MDPAEVDSFYRCLYPMKSSKSDVHGKEQAQSLSVDPLPPVPAPALVGHLLKGVEVQQLSGMKVAQIQLLQDAGSKDGEKPELYLLPVTLTKAKLLTDTATTTAAVAAENKELQVPQQQQTSTTINTNTNNTTSITTTTAHRSLYDDGQLFSTEADIRPRCRKNRPGSYSSSDPACLALLSKPSRYQVSYLCGDSKVVIALLLAIEVEHFRAADFEAGQQAVIEQFRQVTDRKGTASSKGDKVFNHPIEGIVSAVERFTEAMNDQQAQEVVALAENCLSGLSYQKPLMICYKKKAEGEKKDKGDKYVEVQDLEATEAVGDYLVGLIALLNAHFRLRPASSAALEASITTSVGQLVSNIARQLWLLSSELLQPTNTAHRRMLQTVAKEKNQQKSEKSAELAAFVEPYRRLVLLAVAALKRVFSIDYIAGLGARVGVKAMGDLLDSFLPFWVMRFSSHEGGEWAGFYGPVEDFGDSHLFCGRESGEEEEDNLAGSVFPVIASPGETVSVIALLTALLKLIVRLSRGSPLQLMREIVLSKKDFKDVDVLALNVDAEAMELSKKLLRSLWLKVERVLEKTETVAALERKQQASAGDGDEDKAPLSLPSPMPPSALHTLKHLFVLSGDSATLELLFYQLYIVLAKYSVDQSTTLKGDQMQVLDHEMVELGTGVTEKLLRYFTTYLGGTIWDYFWGVRRISLSKKEISPDDRTMYDLIRSFPDVIAPPSILAAFYKREKNDSANGEPESMDSTVTEQTPAATGEPSTEQQGNSNCTQTAGKRSLAGDDKEEEEEVMIIDPPKEEDNTVSAAKKTRTSPPPLTTTIERVIEDDFSEPADNADIASSLEKHSKTENTFQLKAEKDTSEVFKAAEVLAEIQKMQEKMVSYRKTIAELLKKIEAHKQ